VLSVPRFGDRCVEVVIELVDGALSSNGAGGVQPLPEPECGAVLVTGMSGNEVSLLPSQLGESRPIIPGRISQGAHERIRHRTSAPLPFIVTVIIQNKRDVHIIAAGPVSLPIGIWIRVSGEKFESGGREVTLLAAREDPETVDPGL